MKFWRILLFLKKLTLFLFLFGKNWHYWVKTTLFKNVWPNDARSQRYSIWLKLSLKIKFNYTEVANTQRVSKFMIFQIVKRYRQIGECTRRKGKGRKRVTRTHQYLDDGTWETVIFSDESRFCLKSNIGKTKVWRWPGGR